MLIRSISLISLLICSFPAYSQDTLQKIARDKALESRRDRAAAESLAIILGMPIRTEGADGAIRELQKFDNGRPRYYKTENFNAARTISTNKVWPGGGFGYNLTGDSVTLGEWDGGKVRTTHQEFGGRATSTQGSNSDHSTHVAGTMIASGVSGAAKGMSYMAKLNAFDWNSDVSEMASQAAAGLRVSNHSYGFITGWDYNYFNDAKWAWFGDPSVSQTEDWSFGFYDAEAQSWDNVARNAPYYLIVKSAGNDRGEGPSSGSIHWYYNGSSWVTSFTARDVDGGGTGYDCMSSASTAKNVLTVGAVNDISGGYSGTGSVVMSSFSSWGPTDDGRIKPDISANGVNLTSSTSASDISYGGFSGTSMAAPNVSGSLGLILHYQRKLHGATPLRSSTLKALVIHTADEAGGSAGPDYVFGWGLMNTLRAVQTMTIDSADGFTSHIKELLLNQGDTIRFEVSASGFAPLKATLCWTDPAGTPVSPALDPSNLMLKNDLDIRIIRKNGGTVYQPWVLNPSSPSSAATTGDNSRDNVEQVQLGTPDRTKYIVQITHKATLTSGPQNFSVVITGNVPSIGPIITAIPDSAGHGLIPGTTLLDSLLITNSGDTTLQFQISISPLEVEWLTLVGSDTGSIPELDSMFIPFLVDAESLSQWSTNNATISIASNDSDHLLIEVPVSLVVLGPTAGVEPSEIVMNVDTGSVIYDTLLIRNSGYIPLEFAVSDTGFSFPPWLTVLPTSGTVAPGDSMVVQLTGNSPLQPAGDYFTAIQIEHNDSSQLTSIIPIALHVGTNQIITSIVRQRWNLVSLPVDAFTKDVQTLYPHATSAGYEFTSGGYVTKDTLETGKGYWIKFSAADTIYYNGYIFGVDTIDVGTDWNIIGSLSAPIPTSSITTIPEGILQSAFFGYEGGYLPSDSIVPGKGYWVRVSQPGQLILSQTARAAAKQVSLNLNDLPRLSFKDASGNRQALYVGKPGSDPGMLHLPPKAPIGGMDVRYATGSMLHDSWTAGSVPILFDGGTYPLIVDWNSRDQLPFVYLVVDKTEILLQDGVSLTLEHAPHSVELQVRQSVDRPSSYNLGQNFPNPVNPSTQISYDIPNAGQVTIKVYSLLGSEVATLVDQYKEAGRYTVDFDASLARLTSGVYLYRLQAGRISLIRKMILMK